MPLFMQWSADAVEGRGLAAKKAKLATAELAKLSRRVCGEIYVLTLLYHVHSLFLDFVRSNVVRLVLS